MAMDIAVEWDGKTYDLQFSSITPSEWRALKTNLGLKAGAFLKSFSGSPEDLDADACLALLWLMQKRAGEHKGLASDFPDGDSEFDLLAFVGAIGEEMKKRAQTDAAGALADEVGETPKADSAT